MKNIFFNDEVLNAEKKIISSLRIPSLTLMENAGRSSSEYLTSHFSDLLKRQIVILAGKGNNAGDGFVIARHLSVSGINIKIINLYTENELKGDALINYDILKNMQNQTIEIVYSKDHKSLKKEIPDENVLIIDAIFGVGFKGDPDKRIKGIFKFINSLNKNFIVSLDTPSGLCHYDQNAANIKADLTFAMGVKKFHSLFYRGKEDSGKIRVMNIGIGENCFTKYNTDNIFEIEKSDVMKILPRRNINSNKYSNGKVFILSGSMGLTGAAYLCSKSAMMIGSGAVITGVPVSINDIMETKLTEVMTIPLAETDALTLSLKCYDKIKKKLEWADTVLIGPGLSKNEETMELVRKIVKENDLNFVIDADGINAFKGNLNIIKNRKIILTPHTGEFANLTGNNAEYVKNNFYKLAKEFALQYKIILVLKNSPTIITDGNVFYVNSTGRENLATAGTGDVLSGIIAGMYSRTGKIMESAATGVYIHGRCGDKLYDRTGSSSTLAGDLLDEIAKVKKELGEK